MKKIALAALCVLLLGASISSAGFLDELFRNVGLKSKGALDTEMIRNGLKEALQVGTDKAVDALAVTDGYFAREAVRIAMPEKFSTVADVLRKIGFQNDVDAFERSMNRAAEKAVPRAREYFVDAIRTITIDDAKKILDGGDTAATDYFRDRMYGKLYDEFKPSVSSSMDTVGVARSYEQMMDRYSAVPFVEMVSIDLDDYVTSGAIDGLFTMVAEEEKKIRTDPSARVTELLKKVFTN